MVVEVNPTASGSVGYPPATPECDASPPGSPPDTGLPETGAYSTSVLLLASVLLIGGVALVAVTRTPRREEVATTSRDLASRWRHRSAERGTARAASLRHPQGRLAQLEERHVHTVEVRRSRRLSPTRKVLVDGPDGGLADDRTLARCTPRAQHLTALDDTCRHRTARDVIVTTRRTPSDTDGTNDVTTRQRDSPDRRRHRTSLPAVRCGECLRLGPAEQPLAGSSTSPPASSGPLRTPNLGAFLLTTRSGRTSSHLLRKIAPRSRIENDRAQNDGSGASPLVGRHDSIGHRSLHKTRGGSEVEEAPAVRIERGPNAAPLRGPLIASGNRGAECRRTQV